jgi:flavin reductase (DIM6/NTAB) family NADH-FMN oxidoreductase RutF
MEESINRTTIMQEAAGNQTARSDAAQAGAAETDDFDPGTLSYEEQYKLMVGSVVPRPIALVTTQGPHGPNAAPFSFFNAFGVDPPMIAFAVSSRDGVPKDTARNIRDTGEFVVHIVDDALKEKMNICAIEYASEVNEIAEAGLRTAPSFKVRPPRLIECPVQMECKLTQIVPMGRSPYEMIIGEVVQFHYRKGLVNARKHVDPGLLNPLGRLAGYDGYIRITDRFSMPRLPVPPGKKPA